MSKLFAVRKDNLKRLAEEHGGFAPLAKLLGHANPSRLSQLIGAGVTDDISEKVARGIEKTLGLSEGFLDEDRGPVNEENQATAVGSALRELVMQLGNDSVRQLSEERFGMLCVMVLHEFRATGRVETSFIQRLVRLVAAK
jgi:hypothetical protein